MALMIEIGHDGWMTEAELRAALHKYDPALDIRTRAEPGDLADVTMLAVSRLAPDLPAMLPNLTLVQKLGAGVETIVAHPALADDVRVTRLKSDAPAREIAEWVLGYILREQRQMRQYEAAQQAARWDPVAPRETPETRVGVLGLGFIGGRTARLLRDLGFQTHGWSRSPKEIDGITCHHESKGLSTLLGQCDHVAAILPSTPETRGMMDALRLAGMKPGATLLNAGRGDLIDEPALLTALDAGRPGHAVLDVTSVEPLPGDSPLWSHPGVTITPHVSGWHLGEALADVTANYHRLRQGEPLLHEVDRHLGY